MARLATDANSHAIQALKVGTTETVSASTSSASTATAFTSTVVRVVSQLDCFVASGSTATTSDAFLPANTVEYFRVVPGEALSVITASGSGTVYVTSMS